MLTIKVMKTLVKPTVCDSGGISVEYAHFGEKLSHEKSLQERNREREKLKEQIIPFIKETVKKQLKEEREYYKSRPSLAARQLETVLGTAGAEKAFVPIVTDRVYERIERQLRLERLRKGR